MVRARQSLSRDFFIFVALYLAVKFVLGAGLSSLVLLLGASSAATEVIVAENEMTLQLFSIFTGLLLIYKWKDQGTALSFVKNLAPRPRLTTESFMGVLGSGALKGFLIGSGAIAGSLFLGFIKIESVPWDLVGFWHFLPPLLAQAVGLVLWIFVFDRATEFLWSCLVEGRSRHVEGRLLMLAIGTYQLFQIFNGSSVFFDQLFTGLVCALAAAAYLLWYESSRFFYGDSLRAFWIRISALSGFFLGLFHVYGLSVGGNRLVSLMNTFPGPLPEATGTAANAGIVGQTLLVVTLLVFTNVLLRRVLRLQRA